MKKTYKLTGVDCANCAAKIEDRIAKLEGVKECSVNFIMQKLIIEAEEQDFDSIIEKASAIAKKVDREAKITAK